MRVIFFTCLLVCSGSFILSGLLDFMEYNKGGGGFFFVSVIIIMVLLLDFLLDYF